MTERVWSAIRRPSTRQASVCDAHGVYVVKLWTTSHKQRKEQKIKTKQCGKTRGWAKRQHEWWLPGLQSAELSTLPYWSVCVCVFQWREGDSLYTGVHRGIVGSSLTGSLCLETGGLSFVSSSPLIYFHPAVQTADEVNGAANEDQRPPCCLSSVRKQQRAATQCYPDDWWQVQQQQHPRHVLYHVHQPFYSGVSHYYSRRLYCLFIWITAYRTGALAKCCHDTNSMKYCRCRSANSGWCSADRIAVWAVMMWWSCRLKGMRRLCHVWSQHQCRLMRAMLEIQTDSHPSVNHSQLLTVSKRGRGMYSDWLIKCEKVQTASHHFLLTVLDLSHYKVGPCCLVPMLRLCCINVHFTIQKQERKPAGWKRCACFFLLQRKISSACSSSESGLCSLRLFASNKSALDARCLAAIWA